MNNTFQSKKYTPSYIQHVIISISKMQSGFKLRNWYIILIDQKYTVSRYELIAVIVSFSLRIANVLYHWTHILHATSFSVVSSQPLVSSLPYNI